MHVLLDKLKEVLFSVLPVTLIVIILNFTIARGALDTPALVRFIIGAVLIIIGLTIFLIGIDLSITPIGNLVGSKMVKTNKIWIVAALGIGLGFLICVAEPDLTILAVKIDDVTGGSISSISIVLVVSAGVGFFVMLGLLRILFDIPLYKMLLVTYFIIMILGIFVAPEFLAIAFDSSGATTGAITVPFVLALALGVSALKKNGKKSEKDSFGLVGLASAGAILGVLILNVINGQRNLPGSLDLEHLNEPQIIMPFIKAIPHTALEAFTSLAPIIVIFIIFEFTWFKLGRKQLVKIFKGLFYVLFGLVIFLIGVNAGFMDVGSLMGKYLAELDNKIWLILVSLVLGFAVILAEPAVYVLTHQIEDVTNGYVKRKIVLFALSIGMGLALVLNVIRILVPGMELWHILLPGYLIAIALMFFTPKLFVGMAFDSGGVASGPMSATFILAFSQGVAFSGTAEPPLADAFGVIALIAFTPILTVQILGILFKIRSKKEGLNHEL